MAIMQQLELLNRDALDLFVQDKFPHVYKEYSPLMTNAQKIQFLRANALTFGEQTDKDEEIGQKLDEWLETRPGGRPRQRTEAAKDVQRMLLLLPTPLSDTPLEAAKEAAAIRDALQRSTFGRTVDIQERSCVTADRLRDAIAQVRPHAIHIATHGYAPDVNGSQAGGLQIQDERGYAVQLSPEDLRDLIRQGSGAALPRLVTLTVCSSDAYAASLQDSFDCVIGMKGEISADAAITFAGTFYRYLGDGDNVAAAFEKARTSVRLHDRVHGERPALHAREGNFPERTYFPRPRA